MKDNDVTRWFLLAMEYLQAIFKVLTVSIIPERSANQRLRNYHVTTLNRSAMNSKMMMSQMM